MTDIIKADILILGAGIGGYETFRTLVKELKRKKIEKTVTIVDQNNYFTFTPLLHEAATGSVEPDHCAIPMRELVFAPHRFLKATVTHVAPEDRRVTTDIGTIEYEYCVVALGSTVNYYGTKGAKEYTHNTRSLPAAMDIQKKLVAQLEQQKKTEWTITVVGGGATGVEIAGQLADLKWHDAKKFYPAHTIHIELIQAAGTLVPNEHKKVQRAAETYLKKSGVHVLLDTKVKEVQKDGLILTNGKTLTSDMTIWTTGNEQMGVCYVDEKHCKDGRVPVTNGLYHPNFPSLYAVGDIALATDKKTGAPYPQLGEAAHREGMYVGKHLVMTILNNTMPPFRFKSIGTLIAVGDKRGIGKIGPFFFTGIFAWWLRRTVYVKFMPRWSRKIRIVFDWTIRLFGPRYIISIDKPKKQTDQPVV